MLSGNKRSRAKCHKCVICLTRWNWAKCDRKIGHRICFGCRKGQDRRRHASDQEYKKKQLDRYRMRRSAVIFSYGNECVSCQEDNYNKLTMHKIGGGRVSIDFLYNNLINKVGYQVLCYNCRCTDKANKDPNKKAVIAHYGEYCSVCKEDKLERLTLDINTSAKVFRYLVHDEFPDLDVRVLCFNCHNDRIVLEKYSPEAEKQSG
jgi:hypothetical protein